MLRTKRSLLSLVMVVSILASLVAGCAPAAAPAGTAPAGQEAAAPAAPAAGKTKVVWLTLDWPVAEVEAAFEAAHPDIDLEPETMGFNDLFQQIQIRLAAGSETPDVIAVDVPVVAAYGQRGWLLPLEDIFTEEEKADWLDAALSAGSYEGHLLAAPVSTSTQLLFYNKALFERAGLTPPGPDDRLTYEQIADLAPQLTFDENGDGNPEIWGFVWEQMVRIYQLQSLPNSLGGDAIGSDGLTVEGFVNSPQWVDAFTYYWKVFNEWKVAPQGDVFWPPDIFETGNMSMFVGGPWNIRRFAEADLDFEWGVSRHPYFEAGEPATPTGSWHIGVNANSQNKEAAMTFVKWISTGEGAEIWWRKGSGDFPAQKSILELFQTDPEFAEEPLSFLKVAADEATVNPVPRALTPGFLEYEQILQDTFQDIRNGTQPETALNTAVDRISREMRKYQ
jgi:ABC-type glycerol-3-phosphate transport system substrate-binding protein